MEKAIRKSIAWKERRLLTPVWCSFAGILLVCLLGYGLLDSTASPSSAAGYYCGLAYLMVCTVGLAIGIILFSPEREQGTDLLLGNFPTTDRLVASVKFREGAKYFGAFFVFAAVVAVGAYWMVFRLPLQPVGIVSAKSGVAGILVAVLIPTECFLWGLICSLRVSKSLYATLIAAGCSFLGVLLATFGSDLLGLNLSDQVHPFSMAITHFALVLILIGTAHWIGQGWLRNGIRFNSELDAGSIRASAIRFRNRWVTRGPVPAYPWRALRWQLVRTHRWIVGISIVVCIVFTIACYTVLFSGDGRPALPPGIIERFSVVVFVFSAIMGGTIGMFTFAMDQAGGRFRFFQQQADYPIRIWASRVALILIVLPFVGLTAGWLMASAMDAQSNSRVNMMIVGYTDQSEMAYIKAWSAWKSVFVYLAIAALAQLISILIRSGMIMVIVSIVVCTFATCWFYYLAWLNVPLFYFGWPIIASCLLASLWYAPRWLAERRLVGGMVGSAVLVTGVLCLTVIGLRYVRVDQVPPQESFVELDLMFEDQDRVLNDDPEKFKSALDLRKAIAISTPLLDIMESLGIDETPSAADLEQVGQVDQWPDELLVRFVNDNRDSIELVIDSVQDPDCHFAINFRSIPEAVFQRQTIDRLIAAESRFQLDRGDIDAAQRSVFAQILAARFLNEGVARFLNEGEARFHESLKNLIRWSELEGQTPATIRSGMERFDEVIAKVFDRDSRLSLTSAYFGYQQSFFYWEEGGAGNGYARQIPMGFMPSWEVERNRRLFQGRLLWQHQVWMGICDSVAGRTSQQRGIARRWTRHQYTTSPWIAPRVAIDHTFVNFGSVPMMAAFDSEAQAVSYVKVRLALAGFRAQFGHYPEKLAELNGEFLEATPYDRGSLANFAYSGTGVDLPVVSTNFFPDSGNNRARVNYSVHALRVDDFLPAGRPFLIPWSGIISEQREFRFVPKLNELDSAPTVTEPLKIPVERGYWLPRELINQHWIARFYEMEDFVLDEPE